MKREGNEVLFDSPEQHQQFIKTLMASDGVDVFINKLMEEIGRTGRAASDWWGRIEKTANLQKNEGAVYDWVERKVIIKKVSYVDGKHERMREALRKILIHEPKENELTIAMANWGLGLTEEKPELE